MRKSASYSVLIAVASSVVFADQLTKYWIVTHFSLYETRTVIPGFFNLINIRNTGAAFGLLAGNESGWRTWFFGIIALIAIFAIIFLFKHYRRKGSLYVYALSCIAGGA
ncbi:MAG: signal peptidase II, partial [Desulfobulbaceae bacterium]|nr:signal peptidase II [Desulfobulbaceae bacterium]